MFRIVLFKRQASPRNDSRNAGVFDGGFQRRGRGQPSERVNTSKPVSVTSMVCSYCADRLWSLVTTVQPSPSCLMPALPALIIGSMVKIMPASSFNAGVRAAVVQHLRLFVEFPADAVAAEFAHHAIAQRLDEALDGMADVAQIRAGLDCADAAPHCLPGGFA